MPGKSKKPCAKPGCPELTTERYCINHKQDMVRKYDKERGSAAKRGYGSKWQKYRLMFLRQNPLCVECERLGKLTPAKHVDHIKAVSGPYDPLFWKSSNHQALCHSCHSRKTVREDGGFGNG